MVATEPWPTPSCSTTTGTEQPYAASGETATRSFPRSRRVYRALGSYLQLANGAGEGTAHDFDIIEFCNRFNFDVRPALAALKALERADYLLLTDAVHRPARLKFLVTKERLYDYQIKNRRTEKLIKSVLRTSHGAFLEAVRIDEGSLANFLKLELADLQRILHIMHQEEVIEYFPQKDDPQIIFLRHRVDPEHLHIDQKAYKFLKDRHELRIETMIAYCERDLVCRSVLLLQYFGETEVEPCGICDICLSQRTSADKVTARAMYKMVQDKLENGQRLEVEEAVSAYGNLHRTQAGAALQQLLDEGLVIRDGEFLHKP